MRFLKLVNINWRFVSSHTRKKSPWGTRTCTAHPMAIVSSGAMLCKHSASEKYSCTCCWSSGIRQHPPHNMTYNCNHDIIQKRSPSQIVYNTGIEWKPFYVLFFHFRLHPLFRPWTQRHQIGQKLDMRRIIYIISTALVSQQSNN